MTAFEGSIDPFSLVMKGLPDNLSIKDHIRQSLYYIMHLMFTHEGHSGEGLCLLL